MTLRVLVAYSMSSTHVATTWDYLLALQRHSGLAVSYVHVTHDAVLEFDLDAFDVVFHSYCARLCFEGYVSASYQAALRRFRGLKVLAVQDEYDRTDVLRSAIRELGFHAVLTCVPAGWVERVYPGEMFPGVAFVSVLTGYVPDHLSAHPPRPMPLRDRHVVVGYRGRDIGARYGRLAFEKYQIGVRMKAICAARGIPHDIAVDEASRLYGAAWFGFVAGCRAMLGSESGSNVFDFDGSIERRYRALAAANGGSVSYESFLPEVAALETLVPMGQISPRVFECAAMRTPMVLFRGFYSGVLEPERHYIPLEKDFSNAGAVLARLERLDALGAMAERAHADLVASGRYSYRAFAKLLTELFLRRIRELGLPPGRGVWRPPPVLPQPPAAPERARPTAAPLTPEHLAAAPAIRQIAVLEPEIERLARAFDAADAAYRERLEAALARREGEPPPAGARKRIALRPPPSPAQAAVDRLALHSLHCRERRAAARAGRDPLAAPADLPRRLGLIEAEIRVMNREIDALNALALAAIAVAEA
jgi:hypothetical protein